MIVQRLFSIPTDSLPLVFLHYSRHLREFCGFDKVPYASKITRFKQDFLPNLEDVFSRLVDLTEPICQAVDSSKACMTSFDSSGIEVWVTENNPKYTNRIIKQLKAYAKANGFDDSFDPHKADYASMPSHSAANPEIKQLYIDGHFCFAYKIGIVTNGLGLIRHIDFYNKLFFEKHTEITVEKKSNSPDEDKSVHDAKLLIPTLQDFFTAHPLIRPDTFLGDSAFDSVRLYKELLSGDTFGNGLHFKKAYIPFNSRPHLEKLDYTIDENGIPGCPKAPSLPMKYEGTCKLKGGVTRYKFVCPKVVWDKDPSSGKYHRLCTCNNSCTISSYGRMIYTYPEKDLRAYPGVVRGTD